MTLQEITATELSDRAADTRPLLVDFVRAGCPWCDRLRPELERVAADWCDTLDVVTVRVDLAPSLADEYRLRGAPTLVLLRAGERLGSKHGFQRAQQLQAFLNHHLAASRRDDHVRADCRFV